MHVVSYCYITRNKIIFMLKKFKRLTTKTILISNINIKKNNFISIKNRVINSKKNLICF